MSALLSAVKTTLVGFQSTWTTLVCDVGIGPEPAPACGELFIRIYPGNWSVIGKDEGADLDEVYGVNICVTRRLNYSPLDRTGTEVLIKATTGLEDVCALIRTYLHYNYTLMNAVNTALGGSVNGFIEPLRFRDGGIPIVRGADWFSAEDETLAGLSQTLIFGGARRLQTVESMA